MGRRTAALDANRMLDSIRVRIHQHYQEIVKWDNYVTAKKVKNAFWSRSTAATLEPVRRVDHGLDLGRIVQAGKVERDVHNCVNPFCTYFTQGAHIFPPGPAEPQISSDQSPRNVHGES